VSAPGSYTLERLLRLVAAADWSASRPAFNRRSTSSRGPVRPGTSQDKSPGEKNRGKRSLTMNSAFARGDARNASAGRPCWSCCRRARSRIVGGGSIADCVCYALTPKIGSSKRPERQAADRRGIERTSPPSVNLPKPQRFGRISFVRQSTPTSCRVEFTPGGRGGK
jgi:hypothetical protein